MRNYIPLFFFALLAGCEKIDKTEPAINQRLYEVTFDINGSIRQTLDKSENNLKTVASKQPIIAGAIPGYPVPPQGELNYLDGKVMADSLYDEIETIEF